ncbi:myosin-VIIa-like [Dendronephthya gigantea]|uniref:myosin-VIIa-like n=1 Tax=Dendronephthya gigantea TaxID=151771 RepID=UPI001068D792|nr:myosin-VIIa-like [Dendronephthya gigantea]
MIAAANSPKKTFAKYAAQKFQSFHSKNAERTPLKQSLHHFKTTLDQNAARAISLAIFRYTAEREQPQSSFLNKPIFRELIRELKRGSVGGECNPYTFIKRWKSTDLEIVHFICGLGILGPQLRDEIFCQIYKQINGNHSEKAQRACWTLFACCLSSFPPSNEFHPYMINILNSAPEVERAYCRDKLERTLLHGKRDEPPSSYEYQAILKRTSIRIAVHLPNAQKCTLNLDSAITGLELKKQMKSAIGIMDLFGFAFHVRIGRQMLVIVSGDDHVMDVISSCEQRAKDMQIASSWKLGLFKEIFSPWHSFASDKTSTELIYNQIITSVKSGEFKIRENGILEKIIAVHCYLLHGVNANRQQIERVTRSFHISITRNSSTKHKRGWVQLVENSFRKKFRQREQVNRVTAAGQVVQYAKVNLTWEFSRSFRCTSVDVDSEVSFEVNCRDVGLYSGTSNLWKILFPEMKKVTFEKFENEKVGTVVIHTIYKKEKQIKAIKGEQIHELLNFFLTGLRKRSRYLLAVNDRSGTKRGGLKFYSGDLIVLDKTCNGETLEATGEGYGTCQRTGLSGDVSGGIFYIIPVIEPPNDELLAVLRKSELKHEQGRKLSQHDTSSLSSGLLPRIKQRDNMSDDSSSRIQGWVESNAALTTHEVAHNDFNANGISPEPEAIVVNSSSEQLLRNIDTYDARDTFTEQRNKRHVINSRIDVSRRSYKELESELYRSKIYVSSRNVEKAHEKPPSVDQEKDLGSENEVVDHGSPTDNGVPNVAISSEESEVSEKDITKETAFMTGDLGISAVVEDHVSVSLEHDMPEKNEEIDGNVLHQNYEEDLGEDHEEVHEEVHEDVHEEDHEEDHGEDHEGEPEKGNEEDNEKDHSIEQVC